MTEMQQIPVSRFTFTRSCKIYEVTPGDEPVTNIPAVGEEPIKKALYKFGFLTSNLLQRYMNIKGNKNIDVSRSLKVMFSQKKIWRYTIEYNDDFTSNIDVYRLSQKEEEILRKKGRHKPIYRFDMKNTPYILTNLACVQWHLTMLEYKAKEVMYNNRVHISDKRTQPITIPSLCRYKSKKTRKSMVVCELPAVKGMRKRDIGMFLRQVTQLNDYFIENPAKYNAYIIVITCCSENQIEDISRLLENIIETKGLFVLYSIETQSQEGNINPLACLYRVVREQDKTTLKIVDLS